MNRYSSVQHARRPRSASADLKPVLHGFPGRALRIEVVNGDSRRMAAASELGQGGALLRPRQCRTVFSPDIQGPAAVNLPDFYREVPRLRVRDPLADFLGAAEGGVLDYGYEDAVKLAGHSCPTVASAYALGCLALAALYPGELPERGGVRIDFADRVEDGVTGVIASVLTLLTGAAQQGGFKGIGGRFVRRDLQRFGIELPLSLRFTRVDSGAAVDAVADLSRVPPHPEASALLGRCMRAEADAAERRRFGELWQQRVARILLEHWDDGAVFQLRDCARA